MLWIGEAQHGRPQNLMPAVRAARRREGDGGEENTSDERLVNTFLAEEL